MEPVRVGIFTQEPLARAGLIRFLDHRPEVEPRVVSGERPGACDVLVTAVDRPGRSELTALRGPAAAYAKPVVFIAREMRTDEAELLAAMRHRVVAVLPRIAVTGDQLVRTVLTVASGRLGDRQRGGLLPREVDVLRLLARGMATAEIAGRLCYSERTVKNVIHGLIGRLQLRNRSHAVAYAFRAGVI